MLAETLIQNGIRIISGGTDTHIVLLDLSPLGMTGSEAETRLDRANITSNKNPVPFDVANPAKWVGLRLGVAAATTRGFEEDAFQRLGRTIADLLTRQDTDTEVQARQTVEDLCEQFPIYAAE